MFKNSYNLNQKTLKVDQELEDQNVPKTPLCRLKTHKRRVKMFFKN